MDINLIDEKGTLKNIEFSSAKYKLQNSNYAFNIKADGDIIESIKLNGIDNSNLQGESLRIPLEFNIKNQCRVDIKTDKENVKFIFEFDNVLPLQEELVENLMHFSNKLEGLFSFNKTHKIEELILAIKTNQLSLLSVKEPLTGYDNNDLLDEIAKVVPMIMDVCSRPKQSLKTEEAILDVSLVKRINSNTMKHLAAHSEHWKARTLTGLIPSRLKADIFEDEINIYENLFFRMAVDDILKFIMKQSIRLEWIINHNKNAIDWDMYGNKLNDYKRSEIFRKLLPDFDVDAKSEENSKFEKLLFKWKKVGRQLSNVEASQFYRSIDRNRRISRNIHQTNILKNDSRYNALYRLWSKIQAENSKQAQEKDGLTGEISNCLRNYYNAYSSTLLLYSFELMGMTFSDNSIFEISEEGQIKLKAEIEDSYLYIICETKETETGHACVDITYIEKIDAEYKVPDECEFDTVNWSLWSNVLRYNESSRKITFLKNPVEQEKQEIKKIFQLSRTGAKGMEDNKISKMRNMDKVWRSFIEEKFSMIKESRYENIKIQPQLLLIGNDETDIMNFTAKLFENVDEKIVYLLPLDLDRYTKIENDATIRRIFNYGESYAPEDAEKWGNYKVGILPVSQTEISSAQRLIKLISMHRSKLLMLWDKNDKCCPICGSKNIKKIDSDTWECREADCNIIWGRTKCSDGCNEYYEWTRPKLDLDADDIKVDNYIKMIQSKETVFDRLIITDFDFIPEQDKLKYVPVCPICGKRKINL